MIEKKYKEYIEKSLYSKGNNLRLHKALSRNNIKTAFVGGSITKGWNGYKYLSENYTTYTAEYFKEKYPDKEFSFHNLSTESANSFIGLSILSKVIDDIMPDIVFIEYAVNNECGHDHIVSFESLVHRITSLPSEPAVVLVFMINQSLYTSQGYMKRIGNHYGLASVSVADTMRIMLEDEFEWSVYSDDSIHPNLWGHKFIFECIKNYFEITIKDEEDEPMEIPSPLYSLDYADYKYIDVSQSDIKSEGFEIINTLEYGEFFSNGKRFTAGGKDGVIRFEADFKNLFAAYIHDKTDKFSDADVFIDGVKASVLQGKSIYGWGNVVLRNACSFKEKAHHIVELKIKDRKKDFVLIEFGIS